MELALYGPGRLLRRPAGRVPTVISSPARTCIPFVFAHCLRDALLDAWFALGETEPLPVVELGAGDGTLAGVARSRRSPSSPRPRSAYTGVEIGAAARGRARRPRPARRRHGSPSWSRSTAWPSRTSSSTTSRSVPRPRAARRPDGGPRGSRRRSLRRGRGAVAERVDRPTVAATRRGDDRAGRRRSRCSRSSPASFGAGYVLLIDYGSVSGPAGRVHGYREHRLVADVLAEPGGHRRHGRRRPLDDRRARAGRRAPAVRTRDAGERRSRRSDTTAWERTMREQQSRAAGGGPRLRGAFASGRRGAGRACSPNRRGSGGFWWLVLATEGLPEPPWLAARSGPQRIDRRCDRFDAQDARSTPGVEPSARSLIAAAARRDDPVRRAPLPDDPTAPSERARAGGTERRGPGRGARGAGADRRRAPRGARGRDRGGNGRHRRKPFGEPRRPAGRASGSCTAPATTGSRPSPPTPTRRSSTSSTTATAARTRARTTAPTRR